jgi:pimeloyl-ACP methyl ester carboxylesterase
MPLLIALVIGVLLLLGLPTEARTLSFDLPLGGRPTTVDVYEPDPLPPRENRGALILVHGFTRTRATMAEHALALMRAGFVVVVPDLPYSLDSRDNARALRELMDLLREGSISPKVQRFVLVGFSAGGLSALLAASAPGVVGYVGLDPFDRPSGIGRDAARELTIPAWLLRAPPSACNAFAIAAPWGQALKGLVEDRIIADAHHCDFEAPTDWICRLACGPTAPDRQQLVRQLLLEVALKLLARPSLREPPPSAPTY